MSELLQSIKRQRGEQPAVAQQQRPPLGLHRLSNNKEQEEAEEALVGEELGWAEWLAEPAEAPPPPVGGSDVPAQAGRPQLQLVASSAAHAAQAPALAEAGMQHSPEERGRVSAGTDTSGLPPLPAAGVQTSPSLQGRQSVEVQVRCGGACTFALPVGVC